MMSSDCPPTMSDLSPAEHLRDVPLTRTDNENANKRFPESELPNGNSELTKKPAPGNVSNDVTHCEQRSSTLKTGDLVFIITFVDVHRVYVCNVKDNNNGFHSFIKSINTYCSTAKSIRKVPKLNEVVGAKYKIDKLFYRAKILKKIDVITYRVQFIDYGNEETVSLSNMVSLPTKFIEVPSKISLVKLKDIRLCKLNKDARAYVDSIKDKEIITIDHIQDGTNYVILKTSKNQNINSHLNALIIGNKKKTETIGNDKSEKKIEDRLAGPTSAPKTNNPASSGHDVVDGPRELAAVSKTEAPVVPVHGVLELLSNDDSASMSKSVDKLAPGENVSKNELHGDNSSSKFKTDLLYVTKKPTSPEHDVVRGPGKKLSVNTTKKSPAPPAASFVDMTKKSPASPVTSSVDTMTESPAPPVTSSVGTMTESPAPPVMSSVGTMTKSPTTTRWKRFKKLCRRCFRRFSDS